MRKLLEGVDGERSDLEFKPPFTWGVVKPKADEDIWCQERVIRGILGLNHHSLGGVLIVGIEEKDNHKILIKGLSTKQLQSFQDTERLRSNVDSFSSEKINYEIGVGDWPNSSSKLVKLVVVTVEQFGHYATLCTHNGQTDQLREGAIYVRPVKGQPRTIEVTPQEFRELQDKATDSVQKNLEGRGWVWRASDDTRSQRNADLEAEA